jgi:hypothetical protein
MELLHQADFSDLIVLRVVLLQWCGYLFLLILLLATSFSKVVSQILIFVAVVYFFNTSIVKIFILILVCSHHSDLFFKLFS